MNIAQRMDLQPGEIIVFNTRLIHGGGSNMTKEMRFSLDFGVISTELVENAPEKKFHFAAYGDVKTHHLSLEDF